MKADRRHELSKGLGALLGLALLIGGVPALLAAIGPSIPDVPPGLDEVKHLLSRPLTDATVLAGLGWAAWMLWGLLTAAVIAEIVAYARRRPGPAQRPASSRGFRIPGLQGLASSLVLTATLLIPPRQTATIGEAATPIVAMAIPASPPPAEPPPTAGTLTSHDEGTNYERYVVRRFDSPWRIAELRLGDGRRWREILDERRRPLGGSKSRVVIFPGQVLLLPAQASTESAAATPGASHTVRPGEFLSSIATQKLGNADRWPEIWEANRGRHQPDGRALHNPNLIRPGWNLDIPTANEAPAPATAKSPQAPLHDPAPPPPAVDVPHGSAPVPTPAPPAVEAPTPSAPAPPDTAPMPTATAPQQAAAPPATNLPPTTSPRPPPGPQPSNALTPDGIATAPTIEPDNVRWTGPAIGLGGLLAAGAAVTLRRARRRQLQRRPAGTRLTAPPTQVTTREVKLERVAADEPADLILAALGSLAAAHVGPPLQDPPDIMCLAVQADHVEAMLATPHPTPCPGWSAGTPYLWSTQSTIDELKAIADGRTGCWPALVTVGALADAPVLLDLEQATVLSVEGPDELVEGFLRSVALQLATAPWATGVQVLTSGVSPLPGATEMKPDQMAEKLRSVVAAAEEEATWTVRLADGDPWPATVAIVKGQAPEEAAALSSACSEAGKGVAVVAQGPLPGAIWKLRLTDTDVMLEPLGLLLDPPATGAVADVAEALATRTQEPPPEPAFTSEEDSAAAVPSQEVRDDEPIEPEQVPLLDVPPPSSRPFVKVLGPRPTVEGWALDPSSTTAEEMVVFLALQDRPVSAETLRELVIPNAIRDNDRAVVKEAASRVRRCLGTDADGRPNLPPGRAGYRLGPCVGTDFGDFKRRVAEADTAPDDKVDRLLAEALELVEGEPFSVCPPRTYDWATIRPEAAPAIIQAVVDAAHRLTQRRLAEGDINGARWAARQGLLAGPMAEVLWRDLATVAEAAGDDAELALTHEQALAACDGDLSPETADHIAAAADRRRRARQLKSQANGGGRSPIT